jgi:hypothetical protein
MSSNKLKKMNSKKGSVKTSNGDSSTSVAGIDNDNTEALVNDNSANDNAANRSNGDSTAVAGIENDNTEALVNDNNSANDNAANDNVAELSVGINAANDNAAESSVGILDTPPRRLPTPYFPAENTLYTDTTCSNYDDLETSGK